MAKKGESKSMKSLAAPRARKVKRKETTWAVKGRTGAYSQATSVPLTVLLRDLLQYANKAKEAKFVLHNRKVKVNGIVRRSPSFQVGLFDVIDLEEKKERFRLVFDKKGRLQTVPIKAGEQVFKVCKVVGKNAVRGGLIQLALNDGRIIQEKKTDLVPGDSVKLALPEPKIEEAIKLEKGKLVYLIAGRHVGAQAVIKEIFPGTMKRDRLITLLEGDRKFQTTESNVIVVGKDKSLMKLELK